MKSKRMLAIAIILLLLLIGAGAYFSMSREGSAGSGRSVIMAFGDSLTYGQGDRDEQGYVGKLQAELNQKYPGKEFQIENYGVKGRESSGVLKELADPKTAERLHNADYFILFIGTNDFINSNGGNLKDLKPEQLKEGRDSYLRNLKLILNILKASNDDARILVLGLYNPYPEGADKIEMFIDGWNKEMIKVALKEDRTAYVPTNDLFKGKEKQNFFSDSLHLNEKGYELLKERILKEYSFDH